MEFWQHIYKPQRVYGGDVITGWLADLFPYLKDYITHEPIRKNSILSIPRNKITVTDGVPLKALPVGLSETTFTLEEEKQKKELELIGGFIGVTQDSNNKCLKPEIGWGIREKDNLSKLINLLAIQHPVKSSFNWSEVKYSPEVPKELIQLSKNFSGVTLYPETEYTWYFNSPSEYNSLPIRYETFNGITVFTRCCTSFMNLKDGRYIACTFVRQSIGKRGNDNYKTWHETWIIVGKTKMGKDKNDLFDRKNKVLASESIKLIAKGIPQLLKRIIAAEGKYYFDDPSFIPDESLDVLLKS